MFDNFHKGKGAATPTAPMLLTPLTELVEEPKLENELLLSTNTFVFFILKPLSKSEISLLKSFKTILTASFALFWC